MRTEEMLKRVILTNVPSYYVTDENCENLYYKAILNNIPKILIGPSSCQGLKIRKNSNVQIGATIAYPSGTEYPDVKKQEIVFLEEDNEKIDEYYVVAAVGYYKSGHRSNLEDEMEQCVNITKKNVYFFIECAELSDEDMEDICEVAKRKGVAGLVTSVSFKPYDIKRTTLKDVKRLKKYISDKMELIAFGEFYTKKDVEEVLEAGADRIIMENIDELL